jgi:hypothetical protein
MSHNCANCHKTGATKRCGRCHSVLYCGKECQTLHWLTTHKSVCSKSPEDIMQEREEKSTTPAGQLDHAHHLLKTLVPKNSEINWIMAKYERTPDLAKEFAEFAKDLVDFPMKEALDKLQSTTILNRNLFMKEMVFHKQIAAGENPLLIGDPVAFAKLLNSPSERKREWFFKATQFSVYRGDAWTGDIYDKQMLYHSFSNAVARKEILETGRVHVAVGYVDLSFLLNADLVSGSCDGPLNFVGYEISPFNVAKTLVIAEMLQMHNVANLVDAVLQVWYSSCWSKSTLELFRLAVVNVLQASPDAVMNNDVSNILRVWESAMPLPILEARREWLKKVDESLFDPVVNSTLKSTRETLSFYFLTGQLLPASVGSLTMFSLPHKFKSSRSRNESCFYSLNRTDLLRHVGESNDFVAGAISLLRQNINRLHGWVIQKLVRITVERPTFVSLSNTSTVSKIKQLSPWTISWNNCLDYWSIDDFHRLARACSAEENTVHYGYSMNWPTNVCGSTCLTLPCGEHMKLMFQEVEKVIDSSYSVLGFKRRLTSPPIDNPINVLNFMTYVFAYKYWIDAFF